MRSRYQLEAGDRELSGERSSAVDASRVNESSWVDAHLRLLEPGCFGQGRRDYDAATADHPNLLLCPDRPEPLTRTAEYPFVGPNLMMGCIPAIFFYSASSPMVVAQALNNSSFISLERLR